MSKSKTLTFECGRCSSMYSISQDDLGKAGAKITCPKCYTFFYLKPPRADIKPPIIEKIAARDGEYQDTPAPPIPGEKTTEKILSEAIEALSFPAIKNEAPVYPSQSAPSPEIQEPASIFKDEKELEDSLIQHHVPTSADNINIESSDSSQNHTVEELWQQDQSIEPEIHNLPNNPNQAEQQPAMNLGLEEVTGNFYDPETVITQDSLSDYPEDPPETSIDRSIVWVASIFLALCAVLFAHYNRSLTLPFISGFQKTLPEDTNEAVEPNIELPSSDNAKYGFPEVEDIDDSEIVDDSDANVYDESKPNAAETKPTTSPPTTN